jgi:hypothetical protein
MTKPSPKTAIKTTKTTIALLLDLVVRGCLPGNSGRTMVLLKQCKLLSSWYSCQQVCRALLVLLIQEMISKKSDD